MLFLTRKIGQSIIINDKIEVQIVEIKGKTVKVGIEFPKNATVLRKEVYESVVDQNKQAATSTIDDGLGFFESLAKKISTEKAENTEEKK